MSAHSRSLTLSLLPELYAILRLADESPIPEWANKGEFLSITRTQDELSVVCQATLVPEAERPDALWKAMKIHGPFKFDEIGILASVATPLADAKIGIFVISTFDTDYLLVQSRNILSAISVLQSAGHTICGKDSMLPDPKETEA